jgi:tetratricopeptide (TPR) repeat protein
LEAAEKHFRESSHRDKYGPGTDYLLFVLLALSDYRKLAAAASENCAASDLSLYPLFWFRKMAGDQHEADALLEKMARSRHYFLRVFAAKELFLKGRLPTADHSELLSSGMHYELPFEEERASLYLGLMQGDRIKALEDSGKLLSRYPYLPDVYLDRMEVLEHFGETALLGEFLEKGPVRALAGKDHRIMVFFAKYYYRNGDPKRAEEYLGKLLPYFRNNPLFHYHLANIRLAEKEHVKAIQGYEETLALAPLFERACYNMGICYYRLGEIERASEYFSRAISIKKEPDAVYNLSVCMIEKKHFKEAYFNLNRIRTDRSQIPVLDVQQKIKQHLSYT